VDFYGNFARLCAKQGKSMAAVAKEIGIEKSTVSRWAKGSVPRYTTLIRIAEYFGLSIGELVGATPETEKKIAEELGLSLFVLNENRSENETQAEDGGADVGLAAALDALRNQPGRRALLSATKNMTEAQVLRMADWIADLTGGNKD
jgi:transcriptional regulator with XRE-family HTH domain